MTDMFYLADDLPACQEAAVTPWELSCKLCSICHRLSVRWGLLCRLFLYWQVAFLWKQGKGRYASCCSNTCWHSLQIPNWKRHLHFSCILLFNDAGSEITTYSDRNAGSLDTEGLTTRTTRSSFTVFDQLDIIYKRILEIKTWTRLLHSPWYLL